MQTAASTVNIGANGQQETDAAAAEKSANAQD